MDLKKSKQASLENKRGTYFILGVIISCSIVLISFEWTTSVDIESDLTAIEDIGIDIGIIQVTRREEPKPKLELPNIKEVIEIVPDNIEIEDIDFSSEVTKNTKYIYVIDNSDPVEKIDDDPIPFVNVEEKPQFNGGDPNREFARYVARNLRYPEIAAENGISGRVIVQFVIDEKGRLIDPKILRSVDPALDAEAIRVLFTSPRWTPGKQRNKPVKVSYVFPFNFVLQ
jgi:protein TonB